MLPYYFSTHYFPYIYSNYSGYYYNHHYYPYTTTTLLYSFLPYNNCSTTNNCSPPSSSSFLSIILQTLSPKYIHRSSAIHYLHYYPGI